AKTISHKTAYGPTQALGAAMRDADIQGFYYTSARCPRKGTNIALFTPKALTSRRPVEKHAVYCEAGPDCVTIRFDYTIHSFPLDLFLVDGALPTPAA